MSYLKPDLENFPDPIMAQVEQPITANQLGRVRCMASSWPARFDDSVQTDQVVPIGASVLVRGREGITLLVQAA